MIFKTELSGSPHQHPSCHLNTNMYKCPSNPIQAQLSIIRVYLNRQQVWQLANNPSNLAIKDISSALLFTGNISRWAQPVGPDQSNTELEPRPLVGARESEGVGTDRIPTRDCWRALAARAGPCPFISVRLRTAMEQAQKGWEGSWSWREQQKHLTGFRPKDKHQLRKEFSRTRPRDEHTTTDNSLLLCPFGLLFVDIHEIVVYTGGNQTSWSQGLSPYLSSLLSSLPYMTSAFSHLLTLFSPHEMPHFQSIYYTMSQPSRPISNPCPLPKPPLNIQVSWDFSKF